jgi:hypothetical protein
MNKKSKRRDISVLKIYPKSTCKKYKNIDCKIHPKGTVKIQVIEKQKSSFI